MNFKTIFPIFLCLIIYVSPTSVFGQGPVPIMWVQKDSSQNRTKALKTSAGSNDPTIMKYEALSSIFSSPDSTWYFPMSTIDSLRALLQNSVKQIIGVRMYFGSFVPFPRSPKLTAGEMVFIFAAVDSSIESECQFCPECENSEDYFLLTPGKPSPLKIDGAVAALLIKKYELGFLASLKKTIDPNLSSNRWNGLPSDTRSMFWEINYWDQWFSTERDIQNSIHHMDKIKGIDFNLAAYHSYTDYVTMEAFKNRILVQFEFVVNPTTLGYNRYLYIDDSPGFTNRSFIEPCVQVPAADNAHLCPPTCK